MPQGLWVEYKTDKKTSIDWIPIKDCEFVAQFIREIRTSPQLSSMKDSEITLHGPSRKAICLTEPISVLLPGNSSESPLHVQVSAPLPVPVQPTLDANLILFWDSLRDIKNDDGFLHFPVRPRFSPERMKSVFVRKAYKDMFTIICKNLKHEDPDQRFTAMAITGTTGIGKSVFLFYVMWRLAKMGTTEAVVLHRRNDRGRIYVFQNDQCLEDSHSR
jgi:hypothetical protein